MFNEIPREKKVCTKRKIHNRIFSVLNFEKYYYVIDTWTDV